MLTPGEGRGEEERRGGEGKDTIAAKLTYLTVIHEDKGLCLLFFQMKNIREVPKEWKNPAKSYPEHSIWTHTQ